MKSKLIVALDVDTWPEATALVEKLADAVEVFKVGSQLFTRVGPPILEFIHARGKQVFLDLKYHDIPNTVAEAVRAAASHRVMMLTVHSSGGAEMLKAAAGVSPRPMIVGVTVLTSVAGDVEDEVLRRAKTCREAGLDGVVASPQELPKLRQEFGDKFVIVTPGIRPAWAAAGDQKRITTPAQAVKAGASYLVVGRPIIAADDPVAAARKVLDEIMG